MWIWLIVSIALGAFGQVFMKIAMKAAGHVPLKAQPVELISYFFQAIASWPMFAAVACYGFSFLLWLAILSAKDLSLARPLMSIGYLITLAYGYYAGEQLSWERVVGTFLIILGLYFVIRSGTNEKKTENGMKIGAESLIVRAKSMH